MGSISMKKGKNIKLLINWIEEIWEEVEIQIYGIIGAFFFFILIYLVFQPYWMKPLIEFFSI